MSKDKYIGYFKSKDNKEAFYVYRKTGYPRWRWCNKKYNCSHNQYVKTIITCDYLRIHCKPITKKEYANW